MAFCVQDVMAWISIYTCSHDHILYMSYRQYKAECVYRIFVHLYRGAAEHAVLKVNVRMCVLYYVCVGLYACVYCIMCV